MKNTQDHFMRIILTALLLIFATQASSDYNDGDKFRCKSQLAVKVFQKPHQLSEMKPQEFTLTIAATSIKIYSKAHFSSTNMKVHYLVNSSLAAYNEYSSFSLDLGKFHYADAYSYGAALITGTCEKL
ncbi:MAG: hypothetical protein P8I83_05655 [Paracoccaceae bacterium]|nr:hypothetical protein [Paracoccaceae bacterium]